MDSSVLSVLQYNINTSGALSALIRCTMEDYSETYVTECGKSGQWKTDIAEACRSLNTVEPQSYEPLGKRGCS